MPVARIGARRLAPVRGIEFGVTGLRYVLRSSLFRAVNSSVYGDPVPVSHFLAEPPHQFIALLVVQFERERSLELGCRPGVFSCVVHLDSRPKALPIGGPFRIETRGQNDFRVHNVCPPAGIVKPSPLPLVPETDASAVGCGRHRAATTTPPDMF